MFIWFNLIYWEIRIIYGIYKLQFNLIYSFKLFFCFYVRSRRLYTFINYNVFIIYFRYLLFYWLFFWYLLIKYTFFFLNLIYKLIFLLIMPRSISGIFWFYKHLTTIFEPWLFLFQNSLDLQILSQLFDFDYSLFVKIIKRMIILNLLS